MNAHELEETLAKHKNDFHPLVPFNDNDKLVRIDVSVENKEIAAGTLSILSNWISSQLKNTGARYAVGGYNEHRGVYAASNVFDGKNEGEEPRRLHLGIDIWGPAGTVIMAPLDGIIHSFAFNNQPGDYGGTIILSHRLDGISFHTLYGHLSLASLGNLSEGKLIKGGDVFASFGIPMENGHWPPHLHFQIIKDMGSWKGDYPGVCQFSKRDLWLTNSPDPELMINF